MALQSGIPVSFKAYFLRGAFMVGEIEAVAKWSDDGQRQGQDLDKNSGQPLWQVRVIDADPEARNCGRSRTSLESSRGPPSYPVTDATRRFSEGAPASCPPLPQQPSGVRQALRLIPLRCDARAVREAAQDVEDAGALPLAQRAGAHMQSAMSLLGSPPDRRLCAPPS